jgi:hypothetical protein
VGVAQDLFLDHPWVADTYGTLSDPRGWTSFNTASFVGMTQTVFRDTPGFNTTAAAKVVTQVVPGTVMVPNPFRPFHNFDTVGLMCLGSIHLLPTAGLSFGDSLVPTSPTVLKFESKYTPVGGDSAFVLVYLTKWNLAAHKLDTIAKGDWNENTATTSYAVRTINMTYLIMGVVPDSQQIFVTSSVYKHGGAKVGSTYYVDNFCWGGCVAGVNEVAETNNKVSVYPNPASTLINVETTKESYAVEVYDIAGRKMGTYIMQNNKTQFSTDEFGNGMYFYSVLNNKKEVLNRGKFEVSK